LRIVAALYADPTEHAAPVPEVSRSATLVLAVLAILVIWFGVYPTPLLNLIRTFTGIVGSV
jgi:NADH:ubiquinone oxidoreductase subunit 4 (subunit M)